MKTDGKYRRIAAIAAALLFFGTLITDTVRTKVMKTEPMFCMALAVGTDGQSRDYIGPGYKIWKDVHPFDGTVNYYITLWVLPKSINI